MDSIKYPKHGIPARVTLIDGSHLAGLVYLKQNERILDMLCDNRLFFPFMLTRGLTLLNKSNVIQIDIITPEEFEGKENLFPEFNRKHFDRVESKAAESPNLKRR